MIAFGSSKAGQWVLDTVLVVADFVDYTPARGDSCDSGVLGHLDRIAHPSDIRCKTAVGAWPVGMLPGVSPDVAESMHRAKVLWRVVELVLGRLTIDRTPALVVTLTEPPEQDKGWLFVELSGLGADPAPGTSFLLDATLSWP